MKMFSIKLTLSRNCKNFDAHKKKKFCSNICQRILFFLGAIIKVDAQIYKLKVAQLAIRIFRH